MMAADNADLQVWFESEAETGRVLLVPYVRAARDIHGSYRLRVVRSGPGGHSRISQSGTIDTTAFRPQALSRLTLDVRKEDQCRIELTLKQGDEVLGTYDFDCPL